MVRASALCWWTYSTTFSINVVSNAFEPIMVDFTDAAILKAVERTENEGRDTIRIGINGGGCNGYEYIFKYDNKLDGDHVVDFGKFKIVIDEMSKPYLEGTVIDFVKSGLNESFNFINPNEVSSCGCGVSVGF